MKSEQENDSISPSSSPLLESGINGVEGDYASLSTPPPRRGPPILKVILLLVALLLIDLFVRSIFFIAQSKTTSENEFTVRVSECNCGQSVAEARALGCEYDGLSITWLPPTCLDGPLTDEFNRAGPGPDGAWPYFRDKEGSMPLTLEETSFMADTGEDFWTSRGWHLSHCNFSWRKMYRAQKTGKMIHREKNNVHHIMHCGMLGGEEFQNMSLNALDTNLRNSFAVH